MKRKFLAVLSGITLLVFGTLMSAPANAHQGDDNYTWVSWKIPAGTVHGTPHGAGDVGWPQQLVDIGKKTPNCGDWYQVDRYRGSANQLSWLFEDGLLMYGINGPEDHAVVVEWYFVYGGDCDGYDHETKDVSGVSECVVPANGTAIVTTTTTRTTTHYSWTYDGGYAAQEPVVTTSTSTKTVKDSGCTTPKAPKPHPVKHHVSYTG